MNEIQQWLINIQARAPNSPVIIVGTHLDVVKDEFPPSFSDYLQVFIKLSFLNDGITRYSLTFDNISNADSFQQRIREKFINVTDPEKCGLPRVLDSVEVSCKTRENMRLLAHLLYDTAFR